MSLEHVVFRMAVSPQKELPSDNPLCASVLPKQRYGVFLQEERKKVKKYTGTSAFAKKISVSSALLIDTEAGKEPPFSEEIEAKIIQLLGMDKKAARQLRSYATMYRETVLEDFDDLCAYVPPEERYGIFLKATRMNMFKSMRSLATDMEMFPAIINDTEKGRKPPFSAEIEAKIIQILNMEPAAVTRWRDYAAMYTESIPMDIFEYIESHPALIQFIRETIHEKEWDKLLQTLGSGGIACLEGPLWTLPNPKEEIAEETEETETEPEPESKAKNETQSEA
jgi:transcriptional regulator with XRE-family HTH domain